MPTADQESTEHPLSKVASDPIGPLVMVELSSHSVAWSAVGVANLLLSSTQACQVALLRELHAAQPPYAAAVLKDICELEAM